MILVAQLMVWMGAAWLMLLIACEEADHTVTFFAVSKALRTVFHVPIHDEADPDLIEILGNIE